MWKNVHTTHNMHAISCRNSTSSGWFSLIRLKFTYSAVSVFGVWISDPPPLVAHAPRLSLASLFPGFNHPREGLDARLHLCHKLHLLLSTHIWPGDKTHTSVNLQVQFSLSIEWNILKRRTYNILVTSPDIRPLGHTNPNIEDHKHLSFSQLEFSTVLPCNFYKLEWIWQWNKL